MVDTSALLAAIQEGTKLKKTAGKFGTQKADPVKSKIEKLADLVKIVREELEQLQNAKTNDPDKLRRLQAMLTPEFRKDVQKKGEEVVKTMGGPVKFKMLSETLEKSAVRILVNLEKAVEDYTRIEDRNMRSVLYDVVNEANTYCQKAEIGQYKHKGDWDKKKPPDASSKDYQAGDFFTDFDNDKIWYVNKAAYWKESTFLKTSKQDKIPPGTYKYKGNKPTSEIPTDSDSTDFYTTTSAPQIWNFVVNGKWQQKLGFSVPTAVRKEPWPTLRYLEAVTKPLTVIGYQPWDVIFVPGSQSWWILYPATWDRTEEKAVGILPWKKELQSTFDVERVRDELNKYLKANEGVIDIDVVKEAVRTTLVKDGICVSSGAARTKFFEPHKKRRAEKERKLKTERQSKLLLKWSTDVSELWKEVFVEKAFEKSINTSKITGTSSGEIFADKKGYGDFVKQLEGFLKQELDIQYPNVREKLQQDLLTKYESEINKAFPKRNETIEFETLNTALQEIERLRAGQCSSVAPGDGSSVKVVNKVLARDSPKCAEKTVQREIDQLTEKARQLLNDCRPNNQVAINQDVSVQYKSGTVRLVIRDQKEGEWFSPNDRTPVQLLQILAPSADSSSLSIDQLQDLWLIAGAVRLNTKPADRSTLLAASLDAAVAHYSSIFDVAVFRSTGPMEFPKLEEGRAYVEFWQSCVVYVFQRQGTSSPTTSQHCMTLKICNRTRLCIESVFDNTDANWVTNICATQLAIFNIEQYICFDAQTREKTDPAYKLRSFQIQQKNFVGALLQKLRGADE